MMTRTSILLLIVAGALQAQLNEQDVRQRLDLVHSGKIEQVRTEVASLIKQLPNDPGVRFLDAYITENGDQAVKKYQSFVDAFPTNEWADDALYKVYQYYQAVGLYKTAEATLAKLNEQYPNSLYAARKAGVPVQASTQSVVKSPEPAAVPKEPVNEAVKEPAKEPMQTAPEPSAGNVVPVSGAYFVQLGVYSQEAKAAEQAKNVSGVTGRSASVLEKQSNGRTVYAVVFAGFADEASARTYGAELRSKYNLDWFLVKR